MKKNLPFYMRRIIAPTLSLLLFLSACQTQAPTTSPNTPSTTTAGQTETELNNDATTLAETSTETKQTSSEMPVETTTSQTTSSTSSTKANEKLELDIQFEEIKENFVVWEGKEIVDEYSESYMSMPIIKTNNPEVTKQLEAEFSEKMSQLNEYWTRFSKEKSEALADPEKRVSVVIHHSINYESNLGIETVFSKLLTGAYRSEYSPAEYFAINIDSKDGHIVSYDELLQRFKLSEKMIINKAHEVMKNMGEPLSSVVLKPSDVNENRLLFDGQNLYLLVKYSDENYLQPIDQMVDLGPLE